MKSKLVYLTALIATAGLTACSAPSTTVMTDSGDKIKLSPQQTLQAYNWELFNVIDKDDHTVPPWTSSDPDFNQPLSLSFNESRVAVQNLCNQLVASYALSERDIDFSQVAGTMRMCVDPELMQYEQQVGQLLPTVTDWSLAAADQTQDNAPAPVLMLHFANGDKWRLKGQETSATKYGTAPETVFLEIAPQTEVCPQSGNNCLKVRYVNYDANGIKTGVGEWALFQPNAIEGYSHEVGTHNIIRVNRYTLTNPPAGSGNFAYEMDMVVESGVL